MSQPSPSPSNPAAAPNNRPPTGPGFQARLIIGTMLIVGISIMALGYFILQRQETLTNFVNTLLADQIEQQAEQQLAAIVAGEAQNADQFLNRVTEEARLVAHTLTNLLAQEAVLGDGAYWNGRENLTQLSQNQWGNSPTDPASVLVPAAVTLSDAVIAEINTAVHLDFLAPQLLSSNPNLLALYFVSSAGPTLYYPNIDLANLVGDFDARQRPYFQAFRPPADPAGPPFWTSPYSDAALNGLVETNSVPVFDSNGRFRGVVAADVLITTITERVAQVTVADTGYAFLIDGQGNFLALPAAGHRAFFPDTPPPPEDALLEYAIFDTAVDIQAFADPMLAGETGLGLFTRDDQPHYLAYAPVAATGYSLGIVVPQAEMIQLYLTISSQVDDNAMDVWQTTLVVFVAVLVTALFFSYALGRWVTSPLEKLITAVEKVADGDLNVDVAVTESGEVGRLAAAFNQMTLQLRDLVGNLETRITQRTRAVETSMEVSRSLSTILDQQQLLAQVVTQVQSAFDYYHVHIYIQEETTGNLVLAGGTGEAGYALLISNHQISQGQGLVGRAAAFKEVVLVPDVSLTPSWLPNPLLPDTKAEAAIPIMVGQEVLGVLDIQHNVAGAIDDSDVALLQSIANQVGVALRNAWLFEQANQRANLETVVNKIGHDIQLAPDIERVLQIAAREIGERLGVQQARVHLSAPRGGNGRGPLPRPAAPPPPETPREGS